MEWKANKVGQYQDIGNGLQMHYHERGSGEPVIFLHGGGQGSGGWTNWKQNLQPFADAGYHAIATDAIGYGLSSKPEDGIFDFQSLIDGLKAFIDAKGFKKVTLVGNSMGGATSIRFAQDYPERMNKLIVMAPGGIGPMERYLSMPAIKRLKDMGQQGGKPTKEGIKGLLEALCYKPEFCTEEILNERWEVAQAQPPSVFSTLNIEDLRPRMHLLKEMPLLILWGRDDAACPVASGLEIMQSCDNSQMVIFSECGHWVQSEKLQQFNRLCFDFLTD